MGALRGSWGSPPPHTGDGGRLPSSMSARRSSRPLQPPTGLTVTPPPAPFCPPPHSPFPFQIRWELTRLRGRAAREALSAQHRNPLQEGGGQRRGQRPAPIEVGHPPSFLCPPPLLSTPLSVPPPLLLPPFHPLGLLSPPFVPPKRLCPPPTVSLFPSPVSLCPPHPFGPFHHTHPFHPPTLFVSLPSPYPSLCPPPSLYPPSTPLAPLYPPPIPLPSPHLFIPPHSFISPAPLYPPPSLNLPPIPFIPHPFISPPTPLTPPPFVSPPAVLAAFGTDRSRTIGGGGGGGVHSGLGGKMWEFLGGRAKNEHFCPPPPPPHSCYLGSKRGILVQSSDTDWPFLPRR